MQYFKFFTRSHGYSKAGALFASPSTSALSCTKCKCIEVFTSTYQKRENRVLGINESARQWRYWLWLSVKFLQFLEDKGPWRMDDTSPAIIKCVLSKVYQFSSTATKMKMGLKLFVWSWASSSNPKILASILIIYCCGNPGDSLSFATKLFA